MRYSQQGDQLAEGIAFVVARVLWLQHVSQQKGPVRAREREVTALKGLLDQLAESFPGSVAEGFDLANDHHEYTLRNRGDWRP